MQRKTPDRWLKQVGENLRRERKEAGLTQEKFAEMIEVAPRTIQKVEAGQMGLLLTTFRRARQVLGCEYSDLLPK